MFIHSSYATQLVKAICKFSISRPQSALALCPGLSQEWWAALGGLQRKPQTKATDLTVGVQTPWKKALGDKVTVPHNWLCSLASVLSSFPFPSASGFHSAATICTSSSAGIQHFHILFFCLFITCKNFYICGGEEAQNPISCSTHRRRGPIS